jgi:hypothetical protein
LDVQWASCARSSARSAGGEKECVNDDGWDDGSGGGNDSGGGGDASGGGEKALRDGGASKSIAWGVSWEGEPEVASEPSSFPPGTPFTSFLSSRVERPV